MQYAGPSAAHATICAAIREDSASGHSPPSIAQVGARVLAGSVRLGQLFAGRFVTVPIEPMPDLDSGRRSDRRSAAPRSALRSRRSEGDDRPRGRRGAQADGASAGPARALSRGAMMDPMHGRHCACHRCEPPPVRWLTEARQPFGPSSATALETLDWRACGASRPRSDARPQPSEGAHPARPRAAPCWQPSRTGAAQAGDSDAEIRARLAAGATVSPLARELSVARATVLRRLD